MLSVIIPSCNEIYLERTIKNILDNAEGEIEIIVILDKWLPEPQIVTNDPRVSFHHFPEGIGQRGGMNYGAQIAKGEFIMKIDAHCAVDKGFDVKLAKDCEKDWTVIPRMYNLNHETWEPKYHKRTDYMYIREPDFRAEYYGKNQPKNDKMIDDVMISMGPCFFMRKDRYWELGGMDERHGSWGQMGIELGCKAWLSGGRMVVNKNTWFAHWFRGGGGPGFPYPISGKDVDLARKHSKNMWLNNQWEGAKRPFQWMIDKFNPPGWETRIETLKDVYKDKPIYIVGSGPSIMEVTKETFEEGCPIIVLNMAIRYIEALNLSNPIYTMQKDGGDKHRCPNCEEQCGNMRLPKSATLLIEKHTSPNCFNNYKPRISFDAETLFEGKNPYGYKEFSANCALKIAQLFGCNEIRLIGMDSLKGDISSVYGKSGKGNLRQVARMRTLIEAEGLNVKIL
jgi:glycosyltransferase involved in cell wall biosynthesis